MIGRVIFVCAGGSDPESEPFAPEITLTMRQGAQDRMVNRGSAISVMTGLALALLLGVLSVSLGTAGTLKAADGDLFLAQYEDGLFIDAVPAGGDGLQTAPVPTGFTFEEEMPGPGAEPAKPAEPAQNTEPNMLDVGDIDAFSRDVAASPHLSAPVETDGQLPDGTDPLMEGNNLRADLVRRMSEGELDSRFDLFAEFEPTAEWSASVEGQLRDTFTLLEENPAKARAALRRLSGEIVQDDHSETALLTSDEAKYLAEHHSRFGRFSLGEKGFSQALSSEKYAGQSEPPADAAGLAALTPEERAALMRSFRHSLDRRVYLWSAAADYFEQNPTDAHKQAQPITADEIAELRTKTAAVRNYFGITPAGRRWRENFEVDTLMNILDRIRQDGSETDALFRPYLTGAAAYESEERQADIALLREHINSICCKIDSSLLTPAQKEVFRHAAPKQWHEALKKLTADQSDPYAVLALYEEYEQGGGGDTGRELGRAAYRMKTSPLASSRRMGEAVGTIYNNPNLKVYISQAFINRFLPIRDPEFDVVQEKILGNPVAGSRRTDTQVRIQLVPDPKRLLMNLVVTGRIVASTKSEVFPAKIFNESYANYVGVKQLEWGNRGMGWSDSRIDVNNSNVLSDVRTNIDFVPILGGLTREMVKGEYQSRQEALRQETREKITAEVKRRIDTESADRFELLNGRLSDNFYSRLEELGLSLTLQDARTTKDWLLASMRLSQPASLGSQTVEPPTLRGAFADLKVHESAVNVFLASLDLGGRSWTPEDLAAHIAAKFHRDAPKLEYDGDLWVEFEMCKTDPVSVSFREQSIRLRLRFDYIELGNQSWEDVEAVVTYAVASDERGVPCLQRDGVVGIVGPMNIRAQIPLRGLFSKIFAPEQKIVLRPKLFDSDERFAGLSTGLCRVTDGWFAVSVTEETGTDTAADEEYPRLKALRERFAQRSRLASGLR